MNKSPLTKVPWQFSVILTILIYVGAAYIELNLPCEDSLFIGLCGLGRILLVFFYSVFVFAFCLYVYIQWKKGPDALNERVLLAGLLSSAIPIVLLFESLRTNPSLRPYELESLRAHGKAQIQFVSFSDTPVYDQETGKLISLVLKGTVVVNKAGNYTIHPMRLKGKIPVSIREYENNRYARARRQYLDAGTPYEFVYLGRIEPLEISGRGYSPDYIEQIKQAEKFSWKVLWTVESYPPFPLYLLGIGAFAKVYPDDSGEYAYITHINDKFQTNEYPKDVFDIR
jgi:hypothetical protein